MEPTLSFTIKTEQFEGPLDLLLDLIEKRKFFVNDIALASVADDYIAHLQTFEKYPKDHVAEFILVASTLILIKSRSLLPGIALTDEEQQSVEDLEIRLKALQAVRMHARALDTQFGIPSIYFKKPARVTDPIFTPDRLTSQNGIAEAMRRVLASIPKEERLPQTTVRKVVSLEEMIVRLTERIQKAATMKFNDFAGVGREEKVHVIVSFLAMLELVKQGMVQVMQDERYSDITIETGVVGTPRYS